MTSWRRTTSSSTSRTDGSSEFFPPVPIDYFILGEAEILNLPSSLSTIPYLLLELRNEDGGVLICH